MALSKNFPNSRSLKNKYNELAFRANNMICGYRLVVRTSGFHPGNRSSILRSRANYNFNKELLEYIIMEI